MATTIWMMVDPGGDDPGSTHKKAAVTQALTSYIGACASTHPRCSEPSISTPNMTAKSTVLDMRFWLTPLSGHWHCAAQPTKFIRRRQNLKLIANHIVEIIGLGSGRNCSPASEIKAICLSGSTFDLPRLTLASKDIMYWLRNFSTYAAQRNTRVQHRFSICAVAVRGDGHIHNGFGFSAISETPAYQPLRRDLNNSRDKSGPDVRQRASCMDILRAPNNAADGLESEGQQDENNFLLKYPHHPVQQ